MLASVLAEASPCPQYLPASDLAAALLYRQHLSGRDWVETFCLQSQQA